MKIWGDLWFKCEWDRHVRIHPSAVSKFFEHVSREEAIKLLELHIEALRVELAHLQALVEQGYEWPLRDMKETLADLRRAERILARLRGVQQVQAAEEVRA